MASSMLRVRLVAVLQASRRAAFINALVRREIQMSLFGRQPYSQKMKAADDVVNLRLVLMAMLPNIAGLVLMFGVALAFPAPRQAESKSGPAGGNPPGPLSGHSRLEDRVPAVGVTDRRRPNTSTILRKTGITLVWSATVVMDNS
jgi:hypothetical protein